MKRTIAFVAVAMATLLIGSARSARADFVVSGYSSFVDGSNTTAGVQLTLPPGSANAVVNFAVYENNGTTGNWVVDLGLTGLANEGGTLLGTGPAGVDTGADYVYFYQIVNLGTSSVDQLQVGMAPIDASSVGYVAFTSLSDGAAITGANPYLGADPGSLPLEAGANGVPTSTGGLVGLASSSGTNNAYGSASPGPGGTIAPNPSTTGNVAFNFVPFPIASGGYSTLLFITSYKPYGYRTSTVNDGATTYNELPAPVPVPATLALLASGVPGLMGVGFMLRRRQSVTKA